MHNADGSSIAANFYEIIDNQLTVLQLFSFENPKILKCVRVLQAVNYCSLIGATRACVATFSVVIC